MVSPEGAAFAANKGKIPLYVPTVLQAEGLRSFPEAVGGQHNSSLVITPMRSDEDVPHRACIPVQLQARPMLSLGTVGPSRFIETIPVDVGDTLDMDSEMHPDDIFCRRVLVFWQGQVEVSKASTQQHLAARVAKDTAIQQSLGEGIILTDPIKFMELYMIFLEQEVTDYLQCKKLWGSQASSVMPSLFIGEDHLPPLSPVNKVLNLLQAPQQPGETLKLPWTIRDGLCWIQL
ncbi:hypothetical protein C0989_004824 [Termitomyces sp. Mn162]|nr:hypothetical protein C0989_004824 [Termitomyces sp. Mn162]